MSRQTSRLQPTVLVAFLMALLAFIAGLARAEVAYAQAPNPSGGQYKSAWYAPDGLDNDEYVWDAFTLASATAITEVQWRGAYTNYLSGAGQSPVYDFTVAIFASIPGGFQPDIVSPPLARYHTNGNAGETPAGSAGGVAMYDYHFTLPSPFQAAAGTKYWIQIIAYQGVTPTYGWPPDWSIARAASGDGSHFRRVGGTGGSYTSISGDCTFTLFTSGAPSATITATVSPAGAGSILGAGSYPIGATATLTATAAPGFGFARWTEAASQVSTNRVYAFTVSVSRTLVANFVPAYTITTSSSPTYGGATTGGGTFNEGASVTLSATAAPGFVFAGWSEFGTPLSSANPCAFPAAADSTITADFAPAPGTTTFDFDNAPVHTSLPISLSSDGLGATFSATGSGFSIQPANTLGLTPAGFSGLCIYPNSVFGADLIVDFSQPVTFFSLMYSPQELGCDNSATMRVTAFLGGVEVGTATTTVPVPGTWPTGTLAITVPGGFDHAVVHYDHRPPTCQDYGVIFLADNLTVTVRCTSPTITAQPTSLATCPTGTATFSVAASSSFAPAYQWQLETSANNWIDAHDGALPFNGGTIIASGTNTEVLQLSLNTLPGVPPLRFRCVATNSCGSDTSLPATLTISCPNKADVAGLGGAPGCDGQITVDDLVYYLAQFFAGDAGTADLVGLGGAGGPDGMITVDDLVAFLSAFFAGCL